MEQVNLDQIKRALFSLKLEAQSGHVKDYSQFKKLRKACAQILTLQRQKELATNDARKQN